MGHLPDLAQRSVARKPFGSPQGHNLEQARRVLNGIRLSLDAGRGAEYEPLLFVGPPHSIGAFGQKNLIGSPLLHTIKPVPSDVSQPKMSGGRSMR